MLKRIYIAAPLFSEADRNYNEILAQKIEKEVKNCSVYLPQRNEAINDKTKSANSIEIYYGDTNELKKSNFLIALLDGSTIDEGVASEIGWVAGWNELSNSIKSSTISIIGLFTDCRDFSKTGSRAKIECSRGSLAESQFPYRNLYTIGCCKEYGTIVDSIQQVIDILNNWEE